ncbi:MAG: hypothetical protein KBB38_06160 [Bacteroidia bacterium]|jgi:hypothetical protein|uniref:DUF7935 family protein n=1 Tax=Candidatus Pollutiaquabacter sp. TaxID=3416354 RepID=UPI001B7A2EE0|nr:hypothetical protein [Bacteroidota bacterium]MBP6010221.1 hypothetical protein [Bacteroidia bacterium]MBP7269864.1 hypothetical protein [Bacteroidia bacterium]MBP7773210.1 hypothetical protein [Bacteroidia bacterium]HRI41697.1 hypothetical protein [Bacteroidia bacterium]
MQNQQDWTDVLLYFVPAFLVMAGMFMVMKRFLETQQQVLRRFLEKDMQAKAVDERMAKQKDALPLRLQAYERMVLFLERINPNSILVRVHRGGMTAQQLQADLVATIRAEFEHNLSQQIYVSEQAWDEVKSSKEEMIRIINNAFSNVGNHSSGIQMSSSIFEQVLKLETLPTQKAIDFLKSEAKKLLS